MKKFVCTNCQQSIGYSEKHLGKVVKCPKCKTAVRLPSPIQTEVPVVIDPFDDVEDQPLHSANQPAYALPKKARSKKRRRSGQTNWLKWGLISGLAGLFLIGAIAITLVLVSGALSPTPESVFRQWRQAMKNDDYGALYDLLCDEGKAKLDPAIRRAARRVFSDPEEIADLKGRALFCKLAERQNLVITNRPDLIVRTRSLMYGSAEFTYTEIEEEDQKAYVGFELADEFQKNVPSNIKGKRVFLSASNITYFNYLELTKQDGSWKLVNPTTVSIVLK